LFTAQSSASRDDVLIDDAKRYRADTEKLQKAVAKEFATKRDKKTIKVTLGSGLSRSFLDSWRSAALHSASFIGMGDLPFFRGRTLTPAPQFWSVFEESSELPLSGPTTAKPIPDT
jgi:hypothetical protein